MQDFLKTPWLSLTNTISWIFPDFPLSTASLINLFQTVYSKLCLLELLFEWSLLLLRKPFRNPSMESKKINKCENRTPCWEEKLVCCSFSRFHSSFGIPIYSLVQKRTRWWRLVPLLNRILLRTATRIEIIRARGFFVKEWKQSSSSGLLNILSETFKQTMNYHSWFSSCIFS